MKQDKKPNLFNSYSQFHYNSFILTSCPPFPQHNKAIPAPALINAAFTNSNTAYQIYTTNRPQTKPYRMVAAQVCLALCLKPLYYPNCLRALSIDCE